MLGLVGESGSGKSTAARAAIRLIEPTEGEIFFDGYDLRALTSKQLKNIRKEIQIVFQDPLSSLNPRQTIRETIGEGLIYHGFIKTEGEKTDRVAHVLEQVGLSPDIMGLYPHQFSGGQQQRISIGRAIAMNPKLIICDEVVSALDVSIQAQILNLLMDLKEKLQLSYLFISHDLAVVRYISDEVLVMLQGKVVESNTAESLFQNPQHSYTQKLLSAIPRSNPGKF